MFNARFAASAATALWLTIPSWRCHRSPPDGSAGIGKRTEHVLFHNERGALGVLGPYWTDIVMDNVNGSLHAAGAAVAGGGGTVLDVNHVGRARLGRGHGRALAWVYDRTVKAFGPRVVAAWTDNGCATVQIELGRVVRTLNGAAISARQFWVNLAGGGAEDNWLRSDTASPRFTVALDSTRTRAVLTPADRGKAWAAALALGNLRVDYARTWPFGPADDPDESGAERKFDGLLYDDQTYRGGIDIAAGQRPGNPLASANGSGVAVAVRGNAKLMATERWTGTRNVKVRMIAPDGVTVLLEKTLAITAS
jgi:hypothetical protein